MINAVFITTNVTDANHKPRGPQTIRIEVRNGDPVLVEHKSVLYARTGKRGTNRASGRAMLELASERDERIWISVEGDELHED